MPIPHANPDGTRSLTSSKAPDGSTVFTTVRDYAGSISHYIHRDHLELWEQCTREAEKVTYTKLTYGERPNTISFSWPSHPVYGSLGAPSITRRLHADIVRVELLARIAPDLYFDLAEKAYHAGRRHPGLPNYPRA